MPEIRVFSSAARRRLFGASLFSSPHRAAFLFTVGLLVFEAAWLNVGYTDLPDLRLSRGNLELLAAVTAFLAATALVFLYVSASLKTTRPLRVLYFVVFTLAIAVEYGYQHAFGRFSEVADYEVALFAINAHILSNAVAAYVDPLFAVPCAAYGFLLLKVDAPAHRHRRSLFRDVLVFGTVVSAIASLFVTTAAFAVVRYPLLSMAASARTLVSVPWLRSVDPGPREEVVYRAATTPQDNIIFIVDESVRGDHLSLNGYARKTTPFLDELAERGALTNWGIAAAATTCSVASNRALLTGSDPTQAWRVPSIFQYAKAMRYRTFYLDGQMTTVWNGTSRDRTTWDVWMTANTFQSDGLAHTDAHIAAETAKIVRSSVGNFVWINKFGVHTAYDLDYPAAAAIWTPVYGGRGVALVPMIATVDMRRRDALINSYDNAVRWTLETFFRTLLSDGIPPHTTIVYTSDHGQTLSEHGERHTHCGASKTEVMVPLFIIAPVGSLTGVDTTYGASHSNVFATLLDLMRFPDHERRLKYDLSLLKARGTQSPNRTYLAQSPGGWQVRRFDNDHQAREQ